MARTHPRSICNRRRMTFLNDGRKDKSLYDFSERFVLRIGFQPEPGWRRHRGANTERRGRLLNQYHRIRYFPHVSMNVSFGNSDVMRYRENSQIRQKATSSGRKSESASNSRSTSMSRSPRRAWETQSRTVSKKDTNAKPPFRGGRRRHKPL